MPACFAHVSDVSSALFYRSMRLHARKLSSGFYRIRGLTLTIEKDGVSYAHVMEKVVIRSGAQLQPLSIVTGRRCVYQSTPEGIP